MSSPPNSTARPAIGLVGLGAFGRLVATHLAAHGRVLAYDPCAPAAAFAESGAVRADLAAAGGCPMVVLATPVSRLAEAVAGIAPHLQPGALVIDVGSVKTLPVEIMRAGLPAHVEILATHPLFGPQSARGGLAGLTVAVCPVRGRQASRAAAFLRKALGLRIVVTDPETHDREMAAVQGLTHRIARLLVAMEPLPRRMTTRSFDLMMQAVDMVRHDAPEVVHAIECANPYAAAVRQRFHALAAALDPEDAGAGARGIRHPGGGLIPGTAVREDGPAYPEVAWTESCVGAGDGPQHERERADAAGPGRPAGLAGAFAATRDGIAPGLWHGVPDCRGHVTGLLAEEIRPAPAGGERPSLPSASETVR